MEVTFTPVNGFNPLQHFPKSGAIQGTELKQLFDDAIKGGKPFFIPSDVQFRVTLIKNLRHVLQVTLVALAALTVYTLIQPISLYTFLAAGATYYGFVPVVGLSIFLRHQIGIELFAKLGYIGQTQVLAKAFQTYFEANEAGIKALDRKLYTTYLYRLKESLGPLLFYNNEKVLTILKPFLTCAYTTNKKQVLEKLFPDGKEAVLSALERVRKTVENDISDKIGMLKTSFAKDRTLPELHVFPKLQEQLKNLLQAEECINKTFDDQNNSLSICVSRLGCLSLFGGVGTMFAEGNPSDPVLTPFGDRVGGFTRSTIKEIDGKELVIPFNI